MAVTSAICEQSGPRTHNLFLSVLVARHKICGFEVPHVDLVSQNVDKDELGYVLLALVRG